MIVFSERPVARRREPRPEAGNHAGTKKKLVLPESVPSSVRLAMWAPRRCVQLAVVVVSVEVA